mgnify:CR=1 FL=1
MMWRRRCNPSRRHSGTRGELHLGNSRGRSWEETLAAQSPTFADANCALLITQRSDDTTGAPRSVAAVRYEPRGGPATWLLLDCASPNGVQILDDTAIASGFDAHTYFFVHAASSQAVRRQEVAEILRPRVAQRRVPWRGGSVPPNRLHPLAPAPIPDGYHRSPERFLLFAPPGTILCRQTFQRLCTHTGLTSLLWAKYQQRDAHLLLTITHQEHLQILSDDPQMLCKHVRTRTGWRLVPEGECIERAPARQRADPHVPPNRPQHSLRTRTRRNHNPFGPLSSDDADPEDIAADTGCSPRDGAPRMPSPQRAQGCSHGARQVATLNTAGLNQTGDDKLISIAHMMQANGIAVLAVQETRVTSTAGEFSINSRLRQADLPYTYYGDCAQLTGGARPTPSGGTGFLVHETIDSRVQFRGCLRPGDTHRTVWLTVHGRTRSDSLHIGNVYLPDASKAARNPGLYDTALDYVRTDIDHFQSKPGRTVVLGDFNAHVGRQTQSATDSRHLAPRCGNPKLDAAGKKVLRLCETRALRFLSSQLARAPGSDAAWPTFRRGTATSIIDHILVSDAHDAATPEAITLPPDSVEMELCRTDHTCVMAAILPEAGGDATQARPRVERWRLELLRQPEFCAAYRQAIHAGDTAATPCADTPAEASTTDAATARDQSTQLCRIVNDAAMQAIGKRTIVHGLTARWMTPHVRQTIRDRQAAHRQWKLHKTRVNAQLLVQLHERSRLARREAERHFRRKQASRLNAAARAKTQPQHMHETLKSMARGGTSKGTPQTLVHPITGEEHSDLPGVLDCLTAHYTRLFAAPAYASESQRARAAAAAARVRELSEQVHEVPAQDADFTTEEVHKALRRMANNKAPGHDGIVAEMLKLGGAPVLRRLTHLFNTVLRGGTVPDGWRKGTIVSIFKVGDNTDPNNYRGITLLPVIDKLFTSLLASRIAEAAPCHFNQFGFCKGRGTAEAQFNFVCALQARVLTHQNSHAFFLDVRKAFDTVNHDLLLVKLYDKGVTGKLWHVVRRLYENTQSRAANSGGLSDYFAVLKGVAQGCPMSPILFNIYIDSLLHALDDAGRVYGIATACRQGTLGGQGYADDCNAVSGTTEGLQRLADAMAECLEGDLLLQEARHKCKTMSFGPGPAHEDPGTVWRGAAIESQTSQSLLGITITQSLSWHPQIARALRNGRYALYRWRPVLRNARLSIDIKLLMIKTHVIPAMTFGLAVWFPSTAQEKAEFKKLTTVVTDALKESLGASWARARGHMTRCLKGDVLLADFGLPSIQTESEAARVRFHYKHAGCVRGAPDAAGARPLLPATGLWASGTAELLAKVSARCSADAAAPPGGADAAARAPGNAEISAALHRHALDEAFAARAGGAVSTDARTRTRHPEQTFSGSIYALVFTHRTATLRRAKPTALCRQEYLRASQRHAAAIAMLRSGHLMDEFATADDGTVRPQPLSVDAECVHCHRHAPYACADHGRDLPWCHIAHKLLECEGCPCWRAGLRRFVNAMLDNAAVHDSVYQQELASLFDELAVCEGGAPLPLRIQFLSVLADPLAFLEPDPAAWPGILVAVGEYLCACEWGLADGGPPAGATGAASALRGNSDASASGCDSSADSGDAFARRSPVRSAADPGGRAPLQRPVPPPGGAEAYALTGGDTD